MCWPRGVVRPVSAVSISGYDEQCAERFIVIQRIDIRDERPSSNHSMNLVRHGSAMTAPTRVVPDNNICYEDLPRRTDRRRTIARNIDRSWTRFLPNYSKTCFRYASAETRSQPETRRGTADFIYAKMLAKNN